MFAIVQTGGKQYHVQAGDVLTVEKLVGERGASVPLSRVLFLSQDTPVVGTPFVPQAVVHAEIIDHVKGPKVIHFVRRRRKHSSKRTKGHRQNLTRIKITDIMLGQAILQSAPAAKPAKAEQPAQTSPKAEKPTNAQPEKPAQDTKKTKAAPKKTTVKTAPSELASLPAAMPTNVLPAPRPSGLDNFKAIKGLGPKMIEKLHAAGVFHYDQMAAWTREQQEQVDRAIAAKGRLVRDDWSGQARALLAASAQTSPEKPKKSKPTKSTKNKD